jgi:iron complex transport system ATP-binding protein
MMPFTVAVDDEAVVVRGAGTFRALSSAVVGGGVAADARSIVNLHVPRGFRCEDSERRLEAFVRQRGLERPFVGLLTGALTAQAEQAVETRGGLTAHAVVTLGLGNRSAAGRSPAAAWRASTINTIVLVDGEPEDAALVNLVITATEAKALALADGGVRAVDGGFVTGTSTDAVVVAASGRGVRSRFGGPVSELGWLVARAVKSATDAAVARWVAERG